MTKPRATDTSINNSIFFILIFPESNRPWHPSGWSACLDASPSWSTEIQNLLQSLSGLCGSRSLVNSGCCPPLCTPVKASWAFPSLQGKKSGQRSRVSECAGWGLRVLIFNTARIGRKQDSVSLVVYCFSVYCFCPTVWKVGRRRKKW